MTPLPFAFACMLAVLPPLQSVSQNAQQSKPPAKPAEAQPADPADLPVSLEKIQKKLSRDPAI